MKLVIAGGTGLVGRALAAACRAAGDEVVILSRRPAVGALQTVVWDGKNGGAWAQVLSGADALVNLSGESVVEGRWNAERKKVLASSRIDSTRALVAALSSATPRPKVFVNASAIGFYGDRGDETLDESAKPGSGFLADLCRDWEREAVVAEPFGVRTVTLRIGIVLARDGGAVPKMAPVFRSGFGGRLGDGRQWMSWIAIDDLVGLIRHALTRDVTGALNATAPEPARNDDFSRVLGSVLSRPAFIPVPAFALRLAVGEMADMLLGGQRVLPKKALDSGYAFKHPRLEPALRAALG